MIDVLLLHIIFPIVNPAVVIEEEQNQMFAIHRPELASVRSGAFAFKSNCDYLDWQSILT